MHTQAMAASGFFSVLPQHGRPKLIGRKRARVDKEPARNLSLICGRGRNRSLTPNSARINRGVAKAGRPPKATPKTSR
jgi:hypothetical protein